MENSNVIKQAKSDIHKVLHPIITFYINKGAKPEALKKYYKNTKRFNDILEDIRNKGSNLIKDDAEYVKLVREILNDMLDDFIAKNKDDEYKNKEKKMKHIKEFYKFEEINEGFITTFIGGFLLYKFIISILSAVMKKDLKRLNSERDELDRQVSLKYLTKLKDIGKIPVVELSDRFFIKTDTADLRILKNEKLLCVDNKITNTEVKVNLTDAEYENFLNLINK